jgi:transcriptional regulator with XRE-family HTH domain
LRREELPTSFLLGHGDKETNPGSLWRTYPYRPVLSSEPPRSTVFAGKRCGELTHEEMNGSKIGRRIGELRRKKGMTLPALAREATVSKGYLWTLETYWERQPESAPPNPGLDVLTRIANALDLTVADLLGEADSPTDDATMKAGELPDALRQFVQRRMDDGRPLPDSDVRSLAAVRFRGRRPQTASDWERVYTLLDDVVEP